MIEAQRIEAVLDTLRPVLAPDGGRIQLVHVAGGDVTLLCTWTHGACAGSEMTMYTGLTEMLRSAIPELGELHLL